MLTELETILIACIPALTSILTILGAVISMLKSFNKLKENEEIKAERNAVIEQNKVLIRELRKQQKIIALFIEKVVKVHYQDLSEVKNDEELQV